MKVSELIEYLQTINPDLLVLVDYEFRDGIEGTDEIYLESMKVQRVKRLQEYRTIVGNMVYTEMYFMLESKRSPESHGIIERLDALIISI